MDTLSILAVMSITLPAKSSPSQHTLPGGLPVVTASDLKNKFGEVIAQAVKGAVAITRHRRTEFVLLPVEHYLELQRTRAASLEALTSEFDAMVARMNTPAGKRAVAKLFRAGATGLGKSAVKSAAHGG